MRVRQHHYLSDAAMRLRQRDGTPPWGVHPCEVDSLAELDDDVHSLFGAALAEARALRRELEAGDFGEE